MPHAQFTQRSALFLCALITLATLSLLVLPLVAHAELSFCSSDETPGGDGQPDDVGNAPQPGLGNSTLKVLSLVVHWMELWMSQIGWGGIIR